MQISNIKKYAVIVAGGRGSRIGGNLPKQFLQLAGKPVLWHTLEAFLHSFADMKIVLVVSEDFEEKAIQLIRQTSAPDRIFITAGGPTRFHSVLNGLQQVQESSVVFVHDGVRCLVSRDLIHRCYHQAVERGSAIPVLSVSDSMRIRDGEKTKVVDRNKLLAVQTPQTFRSEILLPAFKQKYQSVFTDEATVVEAGGQAVFMIEGERENIKITLPVDLIIAELFLEKRKSVQPLNKND